MKPEESSDVASDDVTPAEPVKPTESIKPMKPTKRPKKHIWLFLPPAMLGIAVYMFLNRNAAKVEPEQVKEIARSLRVIEAAPMDVTPRVIGYGTSMPGQIWQAIAEVRGRIIKIHPELASGSIVKQGTILLEIDKRDYELALAANKAAIDQIKAQIQELATQEANTKASLTIEERSLKLAEEALERKQGLLAKNAIAPDSVDTEKRSVLAQRQSVQSLRNTLDLIPSQRQSLEANLNSSQAQLAQSERDLERATLKAPFDCRLGSVTLEKDQFLASGQMLFEAYSLKVTEVEARFPAERLRPILSQLGPPPVLTGTAGSNAMATMRRIFDVTATVSISGADGLLPWSARFERIRESVDPQTRTIGVVVAVDDPYKQIIPGRRPPLTKDVFCEVELKASKPLKAILIPASAVHGQSVYLLNKESRLEKREIKIGFMQGEFITIESGISTGDMIIVSDPIPAIEGMLIEPIVDESLLTRLTQQAKGEGAIK